MVPATKFLSCSSEERSGQATLILHYYPPKYRIKKDPALVKSAATTKAAADRKNND
jgi:hypothetical protein